MLRPPRDVIRTQCGLLEYAVHGQGPAVILSHGTGGGYDQGLMLAQLLEGFQGISVSRAGYLRTPLETGLTPTAMADGYANLLDALQIKQAAVLGLSAGGMSAACFALRHPDRCWGLVLAAAITRAPPDEAVKFVARINSLPGGVAWLITRLAVHLGLPLMIRDTETRSLMRVFFENNPISERRAGVRCDLANVHAMDDFPWEQLRVPCLLIHGDRDNLIPVEYSETAAQRMPHGELIIVKGGGHECLVAGQREVAPLLNDFLTRQWQIHKMRPGEQK